MFKRIIQPLFSLLAFSLSAFATLFPASNAEAKGFSVIRDAEIETSIRMMATPLFLAAGLDPDAVKIRIINDPSLNAFVAGGQNLFINSGLIIKSKSASEVAGVLAHETGHIAGGHIVRTLGALKNASNQSILGFILGGAAALGGRPDVGAAIILGAQQASARSFFKFSRTQESAADRAAVRYLEATRQSSQGLLDFMEVLRDQDLLSADRQVAYVRTHPLTRDRIEFIANHVAQSKYSSRAASPKFMVMHARMKAKLEGFLNPTSRTLRNYPASDRSVAARYARAIAYYRRPNLKKALPLIDELISERPGDPYFHELKGQMLFENGRGDDALPAYQKAVAILPESALLRADLARVQIERNDPALNQPAIENLLYSLDREPNRPSAWRQLAIAYGRAKQMGKSSRALAETALLRGRFKNAIGLAKRAQRLLKRGAPDWLRSEDIIAAAREGMSRRDRQ